MHAPETGRVRPGDAVPLVAQRTVELPIGMMAIAKAGACYIPIDARYPERRIRNIIEQSGSPIILFSNHEIHKSIATPSRKTLSIDNISLNKDYEALFPRQTPTRLPILFSPPAPPVRLKA